MSRKVQEMNARTVFHVAAIAKGWPGLSKSPSFRGVTLGDGLWAIAGSLSPAHGACCSP